MVQGDQPQGKRAGPQPYVPPVPPPPHRPAQPNRRKGLILALTVGGAAFLAMMVFLVFVLVRGMLSSAEETPGNPGQGSAPQEGTEEEAPLPGNDGSQVFSSNDGLVEYHLHGATCGMRELDTRVATLTNGEYCVVELEVTNNGTDPLHLEADRQWLGGETRMTEASEPSKEESVASLWDEGGIPPEKSAQGPLVFIIPDTHPREFLLLSHKDAEETGEAPERDEDFTEIPISEILESSTTYEFDLET